MLRVIVLLVALAAGGCRVPQPIEVTRADERELVEIARAFERTIEKLEADPATRWHAGWAGNVIVNAWGGDHRGLCYEWQEAVYTGVRPTVEAIGWSAVGIALNREASGEHHAVLVYDPARYAPGDPPAAMTEDPAYILDAWRRGRADIYTFADWLAIPRLRRSDPVLEDLDAIMAQEAQAGAK